MELVFAPVPGGPCQEWLSSNSWPRRPFQRELPGLHPLPKDRRAHSLGLSRARPPQHPADSGQGTWGLVSPTRELQRHRAMSVVTALTAHIGVPAEPIPAWLMPGLLLSLCVRLGALSEALVGPCCGATSSCSQCLSPQSLPMFPLPCLAQAAGAPWGVLAAAQVSCAGTHAPGSPRWAQDGTATWPGGFLLRGRVISSAPCHARK